VKILFDQGVPKPLQPHLSPHEVQRAFKLGWATKKNGELLSLAEAAGFDVLVTTDQNLRYQLNLQNRKLAVFILSRGNWPQISPCAAEVASKIKAIRKPGLYICTIPPSA